MKEWIVIPEDWLFKIVSNTLTTTLTFYLFEFYAKWNLIGSIWEMDEKNYIRSFLVTQVIVSGVFYAVLSSVIKRPISKWINKWTKKLNFTESFSDLKELSYLKTFLIRVFSMQVRTGKLDSFLLNDAIDSSNKENEINTLIIKSCKWITVFIQLAITLIFVFHLSAWYILPLILIILTLLILFIFAASIVIHNIELIEKIRLGIIKRQN